MRVNHQNRGEAQWKSRLTEKDIPVIRALYRTGRYTYRQIAEDYQMSVEGIWKVVNKINWNHIK